jgi:plastocyanin
MEANRRQLLRTATAVAAGLGLAGCSGSTDDGASTDTATDAPTDTPASTEDDAEVEPSASVGAGAAVAAEWTVMSARLDDAYTLGLAGMTGEGEAVAGRTFERFEGANGEYGAHEYLEETSTTNYEGFESGLVDLRDGLSSGDKEAAEDGWRSAQQHLREAQIAVVGETGANALGVLRYGVAVNDVELLAAAGETEAAATVAGEIKSWFENAPEHGALESADSEAYESLEGAMEDARRAASAGNVATVRSASDAAISASVTGANAIASGDLAAAGHLAAYQAEGWDAAALASLGGPSTNLAHAAVLNSYRARVYDAHWLAARGATDTAQTMVDDVFEHFETDAHGYHEALEEADGEAYEGFERGLNSLSTAIGNGDSEGIDSAVATVDENLVTGIEALAGSTGATLLEAAFFRARVADAREIYRLGANNVASGVVGSVFERFEADEAGFHEAFEDTDAESYEAFESALSSLRTAMENTNDSGVETHATAVMDELLGYVTTAGSTAQVSAAESTYVAARGFDAAALAALDKRSRANTVVTDALTYFEGGAGGFHEALEDADGEVYESFEADLSAVGSAAGNDSDAYAAATTFYTRAVEAAYATVAAAGGSFGGAAGTMVDAVFTSFEANDGGIHETLEDADEGAYENFESGLDGLSTALAENGDVRGAASAYANTTLRAQFAVVGALDDAPVSADGGSTGEEKRYAGGPNVQQGTPSDADHVIDMNLVAFDPKEITVQKGETIAWTHNKGEPHSVTAYEDSIPSDAEYWASGGFDSESAARAGWNGGDTIEGAIRSGESYVHTFETTGTHEYVCIPHEEMGMKGTVVVEE